MLDIVFILLIFFIVTAVFLDESGVDFTQAQGEGTSVISKAAISIVIDERDKITVEGRVVSLAVVEAEVQRHLVHSPEAIIDLRAAETARLLNVVAVKDDMEQAGRTVRFETFVPTLTSAGLD
jgi:biopolymer transport protein ExbD